MKRINILLIGLSVLLSSCATIVPVEVKDADNERCQLSTKKLSLDAIEHHAGIQCRLASECLAALGVSALYTATTTVISGSIVLLGNTVHWLEKQGKCSDGFLSFSVEEHNEPLIEQDGEEVIIQ